MMNKDNANGLQIQMLLESDLLQAPDDFDLRVLREIEREKFSTVSEPPCELINRELINREQIDRELIDKDAFDKFSHGMLEWWQWLAVFFGSLVGVTQVSRFIFGFWLSAAVS